MIEVDEVFDGQGNVLERRERTVTPEEQVERRRQAIGLPLTTEEYNAVRTQMQTLRALRQMGRNAFMALTAAERDRMLYDAFTATTTVLLSILRDDGPEIPAAAPAASPGRTAGSAGKRG